MKTFYKDNDGKFQYIDGEYTKDSLGVDRVYHYTGDVPAYDYKLQDFEITTTKDSEGKELVMVGVVDKSATNVLAYRKELLISEIESYDKSTAVNSFSINGGTLWLSKEERGAIRIRFELAKATKSKTSLWVNGQQITLSITKGLEMLNAIENYAISCYDQTQLNLSKVRQCKTLKELELLSDYKISYIAKLKFTI